MDVLKEANNLCNSVLEFIEYISRVSNTLPVMQI